MSAVGPGEAHMLVWLLGFLIVVLFMMQCAWLTMFVLDFFFDTSRSTAAERARTIAKFAAVGILLQISIAGLALAILILAREALP